MRLLLAAVLALSISAGCGDDTTSESGPGGGSGGDAQPAGPDAGVPSDACAEGFSHDGDFGCVAILPADACPPGLIAVPGDEACRALADCGSGTWGNIPLEPSTEYVDQAYAGGSSDGTASRPWTSVQAGVDAAAFGAIVAVAAGSYPENVLIDGKPVRLWGRCPEMVTIDGTASAQGSIQLSRANGGEIRSLSTQGVSVGVVLTAVQPALLDALWIHDTGEQGVEVSDTLGPAEVLVTGSLIDSAGGYGVVSAGAQLTLERSAIRDTRERTTGQRGRAVYTIPHPQTGTPSNVRVDGSLLERNHDASVSVAGSELHVAATAIRDTLPNSDGMFGFGILAQSDSLLRPSTATVETSTIERCRSAALAIESSIMTATHTTIVDTAPEEIDQRYGRGVQAQTMDGDRTSFSISASLVSDSLDIGVFGIDADISVDATVVRRTTPDSYGRYGDGVCVMTSTLGASGRITGSIVADNARAGISNFGATVTIGDNLLSCNVVQLNGEGVPGPYSYEVLGGNLCQCGDEVTECRVLSAGLEPPAAL